MKVVMILIFNKIKICELTDSKFKIHQRFIKFTFYEDAFKIKVNGEN